MRDVMKETKWDASIIHTKHAIILEAKIHTLLQGVPYLNKGFFHTVTYFWISGKSHMRQATLSQVIFAVSHICGNTYFKQFKLYEKWEKMW